MRRGRYSVKPSRSASAAGVVGGLFALVFIALFASNASEMFGGGGKTIVLDGGREITLSDGGPFGGTPGPPPAFRAMFALLIVGGVVATIGGIVYHFHNATQRDRFSHVDVVPTDEEPEPRVPGTYSDGPAAYCTSCGGALRVGDRFCAKCGARAAA